MTLLVEGRMRLRVPSDRLAGSARALAVTTYALVLGAWVALLGVPNDTLQVFLWLWAATVAWNIRAPWRSHLDFVRDWSLPLAGLVVYFYSRGLTDELGLPVHVQAPIDLDRWLGGGVTPTERLQQAWCGEPCTRDTAPRFFDVYFTSVYATHFVAGLTLAAVLWMRSRVEWVRWMRRYLAINFGALVVYVAYPMAPPWMASQEGHLGPVSRITGRGWSEIGLHRIDAILMGVGNPVAAMPSLHAGVAFLIAAYGVQRLRTRWRWLLVLYPLSMSTALVYYAEHYVVDVLAGALLAGAVLVGASAWERSARQDARPLFSWRRSTGTDASTLVRSAGSSCPASRPSTSPEESS